MWVKFRTLDAARGPSGEPTPSITARRSLKLPLLPISWHHSYHEAHDIIGATDMTGTGLNPLSWHHRAAPAYRQWTHDVMARCRDCLTVNRSRSEFLSKNTFQSSCESFCSLPSGPFGAWRRSSSWPTSDFAPASVPRASAPAKRKMPVLLTTLEAKTTH